MKYKLALVIAIVCGYLFTEYGLMPTKAHSAEASASAEPEEAHPAFLAIERALGASDQSDMTALRNLRDLARVHGIRHSSFLTTEEFEKFYDRMLNDTELLARIHEVRDLGITISADKWHAIGAGWIAIVSEAETSSILLQLSDAAVTSSLHQQAIVDSAASIGLEYGTFADFDDFETFYEAALSDELLLIALQQAQAAGISIEASDRFEIESGRIEIDTKQSPARVLQFLLTEE